MTETGSGPRVVLVHGSVLAGRASWARQAILAARWRLVIPDRRGFGASAHLADGQDCLTDAEDIVHLLHNGAHLVGHSYGALGSLLAAARRPCAVRSLAVVEPPCFAILRGHPTVETFVAGMEALVASEPSPQAFLDGFSELAGVHRPPVVSDEAMRPQLRGRWPWTVEVPVAELAAMSAPRMVVSGGHSPLFELVCDALAERIGAERAVVEGASHTVPFAGRPFNRLLEGFWDQRSSHSATATR